MATLRARDPGVPFAPTPWCAPPRPRDPPSTRHLDILRGRPCPLMIFQTSPSCHTSLADHLPFVLVFSGDPVGALQAWRIRRCV